MIVTWIPCFSASAWIFETALLRYSARSPFLRLITDLICWNASGLVYFKLKSSNSFLMLDIPRRSARGAQISRASCAICLCLEFSWLRMFLILSSLSAIFTKITRTSSTMAKSILRMASACCRVLEFTGMDIIRLVPFMMEAMSFPNFFSSSSIVTPKEGRLWRIPAEIQSESNSLWARMKAIRIGWR